MNGRVFETTGFEEMSLEDLRVEEAKLMHQLSANNAASIPAVVEVPGQPVIHELSDDDVVETVYLDNRVSVLMEYAPGVKTVLAAKGDVSKYELLADQYRSAVAEVTAADACALEATLKASDASKVLPGLAAQIAEAKIRVERIRLELEDALRLVGEAENAKKAALEKIRYAEEMESRADVAAFQAMVMIGRANRILIESEVAAAEMALGFATKRLAELQRASLTVSSDAEMNPALRVPFAFRSRVQGEEE